MWILPEVLDTPDYNDTLDLSPRYFWKSGDDLEKAQHALERVNLVFIVDVPANGSIVEAIQNHCHTKNIDYAAPTPSAFAPVTPNNVAWVLTGPRGRSAQSWVEDFNLRRFTSTLQAIRNVPFSHTPTTWGRYRDLAYFSTADSEPFFNREAKRSSEIAISRPISGQRSLGFYVVLIENEGILSSPAVWPKHVEAKHLQTRQFTSVAPQIWV
ncbi:hypothetical protein B0H13DRAFT_1863030 [Mycena leptocephala]|nr:hypothetical protein B0H13DRAFT_1863030 [Mycena leptocephala]